MSLHQSVATNGKDGRGLKLEKKKKKKGPSSIVVPAKISQKLLLLLLPDEISLISP